MSEATGLGMGDPLDAKDIVCGDSVTVMLGDVPTDCRFYQQCQDGTCIVFEHNKTRHNLPPNVPLFAPRH
ncbi:MAG: hypothetical protein BWY19_00436 [bacterium ADurb.Bin212]|nr:MAG: hypothetical protein BWY19_00436 [bacterium ADurb.Bin212]